MDGGVSVLTLSKMARSIAALAVGGTMPAEPWKTTVLRHDLCVISWLRWSYRVDTR